jgi:glutathione S-transferase
MRGLEVRALTPAVEVLGAGYGPASRWGERLMLKIWGRANSLNVQKVMWTVGELGLAHQRVDAGGRFGGLDSPDYLALNPNARIPTIEDDGVVVWESNACIRYLAARYGEGQLWDEDPGKRAAADQWMDWMQTTLAPDFYAVFWAAVRIPPARQDKAAIERLGRRLAAHYKLLDRQLASRPWLAGERLSMADIAIGTTLYRYDTMEIVRPVLAHLQGWYDRLRERPAYREHVMVSYEELRGNA